MRLDLQSAPTQGPSASCMKGTENETTSTTGSKRQSKRLDNYVLRKEVRRELRKAYKVRRKAKRALQQQQHSPVEQAPTIDLDSTSNATIPRSRKALSHAPRMSESLCSTKIVIDCSHDHLMSFKDICKLANQITNCYAFNRRLSVPVQLYVTGLKADLTDGHQSGVRLRDRLVLAGCDHWDIHLFDENYWELFDIQSIVYLCAESSVILPDRFLDTTTSTSATAAAEVVVSDSKPISSNDVFVIGGLVDHNHLLGHCYERAVEKLYRTARLPITESGLVLNGRHVLSTLEVFEALAPVVAGTMTWSESLNAAIPSRKKRS